jgi:hypothetical protein
MNTSNRTLPRHQSMDEAISRAESADMAAAINARNERTARRAESALGVLLAVFLAVLGAMALLHFARPCSIEGALCMAAVIQTRPGMVQRLLRHLRGAYLRYRIAGAKADIAAMQQIMEQARQELDYLPRQIEAHNLWIDHAMLELDGMALDARVQ